jgi:hypothetical protein
LRIGSQKLLQSRITEIAVWVVDDLATSAKSAGIHACPPGMNTDPELTFFRVIDRTIAIQPFDPNILGLAETRIFPMHQMFLEKINPFTELSCVLLAFDWRHD